MQTQTGHIYEPCHKRARLIHDPITNIQLANAVRTMHEPIANYNHLTTTKRTIQEIITNIQLSTTKIIRNGDPSVNKSCSSMLLDCLPLDILISIFTCLSSTASSPLHIIGPRQTLEPCLMHPFIYMCLYVCVYLCVYICMLYVCMYVWLIQIYALHCTVYMDGWIHACMFVCFSLWSISVIWAFHLGKYTSLKENEFGFDRLLICTICRWSYNTLYITKIHLFCQVQEIQGSC